MFSEWKCHPLRTRGQYDNVIAFPGKCVVNESVTIDVYKSNTKASSGN